MIKKIVCILMLNFTVTVYSQLLFVQVNQAGYVTALSDEMIRDHGREILDIYLKYSWPSCIAADLTDEEKRQLFDCDFYFGKSKHPVQRSEQMFMRRKAKEISPDLDVIFVPTTIYELYFISEFLEGFIKIFEYDPLLAKTAFNTEKFMVDIIPFLNQSISDVRAKSKNLGISPVEFVKQEINSEFNKYNNKINHKHKGSLIPGILNNFDIHQKFVSYFLSDALGADSSSQAGGGASAGGNQKFINKKLSEFERLLKNEILEGNFLDELINKGVVSKYTKIKNFGFEQEVILYPGKGFLYINLYLFNKSSYLKEFIRLEYQAFDNNAVLLFRGTNPLGKEGNQFIASTIYGNTSSSHRPFSMSFGNSLFAGFMNDWGACAYHYLVDSGGYVLFINKCEYVDNYCKNLFFIAPLATEAALFGYGEMFHSRSKPVVEHKKKDKSFSVIGVEKYAGGFIVDPYGIFLITRSPYRQESLFSEYLFKHGNIVGKININDLPMYEQVALQLLIDRKKQHAAGFKILDKWKNIKNMHSQKKDHKQKPVKSKIENQKNKKNAIINSLELARTIHMNKKIKKNNNRHFVKNALKLARAVNVA